MEYNKQTIDAIAKLNNTSPDVVDVELSMGAEMTNEWFEANGINNIDDLLNCDLNYLMLIMKTRMRQVEDEEKKGKKVKKGKKGRKIKIKVIKKKK